MHQILRAYLRQVTITTYSPNRIAPRPMTFDMKNDGLGNNADDENRVY